MTKPWHIIPKISKGINHDSTVVVVEFLTNVYDVEFIFEKMHTSIELLSSFYLLNYSCKKIIMAEKLFLFH